MLLKELLAEMIARQASDLHLRVGVQPTLRIDGRLTPIETDCPTVEGVNEMLAQILTEDQKRRFEARNEMDLALSVARMGRFRVNIYRQRGTVGLAIRSVNTIVPSFSELNLPEVIKKLCQERRGLIIVTGTTGSGKSTTLASMIEEINRSRSENIVTIEDPIEYIHKDMESVIAQREVGCDTESFAAALRHAFRQDPDVILIGEIRDLETMMIALTAADTGHLVLTTLHTLNAIETISRIISFFPPHQHQQIRLLLSGTLSAIISQRLLPRCDGPGRVPAIEVLIGTGTIRDAILDPEKTSMIYDLIEGGSVQYGMQTFDQSIMRWYRLNVISYEMAMSQASNPDDFDLRVKGITGAADRGWTEFQQVTPSPATKKTPV
ncbi:MAG: type IV pilus twitching motility protein PilT [candidate division Zixibacteria bacterium]|nr:type IV pilus twitching motility protein PilT [candidate division Zixibacteria bacterium]